MVGTLNQSESYICGGTQRDAQKYTEVCRGMQRCAEVCRGVQRCAEVCRGMQRYMEVSRGAWRYAEVHEIVKCQDMIGHVGDS